MEITKKVMRLCLDKKSEEPQDAPVKKLAFKVAVDASDESLKKAAVAIVKLLDRTLKELIVDVKEKI